MAHAVDYEIVDFKLRESYDFLCVCVFVSHLGPNGSVSDFKATEMSINSNFRPTCDDISLTAKVCSGTNGQITHL